VADRVTVRFQGLVDAREARQLQDVLERMTDLRFEPIHIEHKNALDAGMFELVLAVAGGVTGAVAGEVTKATIEGLKEPVRRLMASWPGNARDADIGGELDAAPEDDEGEPGRAPREG
jgi:hypothetical protein